MELKNSILSLLKLSFPIIVGQMGQMLIVAGDVYIAGLYSNKSVASIGVASGFFNPIMCLGLGLVMGISPLMAQKRGKGEAEDDLLLSILLYGLAIGFMAVALLLGVNLFIPTFGLNIDLVPSIQTYLEITCWSLPAVVIFHGLKEYLQGFELVIIPNLIAIICVGLNLLLNYLLVFGWGGFGGLGEIGLAYASLGIRIFMCFLLLSYMAFKFKFGKINKVFLWQNFKFSLPIALMFFLEVSAFCLVSVLSGKLTTMAAATNNIIMTIASVTFMIPMSLGSAVSVKVGHAFGEKNKIKVLNYIKSSIILMGIFTLFPLILYFGFPKLTLGFFTSDQELILLGGQLLFIVGIFQISDALQVILSGILRGLNETKFPFLMVCFGYWIIGLPFGVYLSFYLKIGVQGLWIGLALALTLVAFNLSLFTIHRLKKN